MKWMKQHKFLTGAIVLLLCCTGVIFYIFTEMMHTPVQSTEQVNKTINESSEKLAEIDLSNNPFPVGGATITEDQIQKYLHGMSHQKVEAKDKWNHFEITEERILYLIKQIESDKEAFENSDLYLDILSRWLENDYAEADRDHNAIWSLQGGTIGKATGVLSKDEELKYLEENKAEIK